MKIEFEAKDKLKPFIGDTIEAISWPDLILYKFF